MPVNSEDVEIFCSLFVSKDGKGNIFRHSEKTGEERFMKGGKGRSQQHSEKLQLRAYKGGFPEELFFSFTGFLLRWWLFL